MFNRCILFLILIFFPCFILTVYAEEGVFIPGITDKYNSEAAINKIMNKKKEKLNDYDKDIEDSKTKIKALNEIKTKTQSLQEKAKALYGFDTPFDKKICKSSDENAFTASANKNVEVGEYKISIKSKASNHKIASKPLDKSYKISAGEYNFQIGKDRVKISFGGGSVESFASKIESDSKGLLKTTITWNTPKTQVLILEAGNTGEKNVISFTDDKTKNVFKEMDFYDEIQAYDINFYIDKTYLVNTSEIKKEVQFDGKTLIVDRMQNYKLNLSYSIPYKDRLIMEIELKLDTLDQNANYDDLIPTGPDFKKSGDINLFNTYVEGESSKVTIQPYKKPEKPKVITDNHFISIVTDKRTINMDELNLSSDLKAMRFELNKLIDKNETVKALIFKNNNTYKRLGIGKVRFYDEGSDIKMRFKHEISKPADAFFVFDGVDVRRDTNTITDLIKGLTLYILDKTNKEESLKIDRDYENMVKVITEFLSDFNQLLQLVNKETDANYNEDNKRGNFAGDYGLTNLVSKLRTIMMNPYTTIFGDELSLLAQIGISTNASGFGSMDKTKLKGIIEVNENKFLEKVEKYPVGVKELFGKDLDGDLVVDSGVGYEIEKTLKAYTQRSNGYFDMKTQSYQNQIANTEKAKKQYEEKLKDEEKKLRKDFYQMEKSADELEKNKNKFDNMGKQ
jgi:flagellar hook-associated protein 2